MEAACGTDIRLVVRSRESADICPRHEIVWNLMATPWAVVHVVQNICHGYMVTRVRSYSNSEKRFVVCACAFPGGIHTVNGDMSRHRQWIVARAGYRWREKIASISARSLGEIARER